MRIRPLGSLVFAIVGVLLGVLILVISTLTVNATALQSFRTLDQRARSQDKGVASTSSQPCANPRLQITAPIRVLLSTETEAITIQVTNFDKVECDITISLVAPNFTLRPADNQQMLALAPTTSGTLVWRVTPTATGLFTLAVTAGNANQQIGISVTSGNDFFPAQPQTPNYVGIFLGELLSLASLIIWLIFASRSVQPKQASESAPAVAERTPERPPERTPERTPEAAPEDRSAT
ncbi:MAG TPA: hypothetical protein VKQ36_14460 [Ktedonobacterales bacterium]|nr:hypothetical protein [Ktedonobacterales bacterium]